jgi:predicted porin
MYTVEAEPSKQTLKGFNAIYKSDRFSAGVGYNTRKNELGLKSLTSAVAGASAAIGPGTISTLFGSIKDSNPTGLSIIAPALIAGPPPLPAAIANVVQTSFVNSFKQNGLLAHVGYRFTFGANTVYTAFTKYNDKTASNADVTSFGAAYSYAFSKRTDVNLVATRYNNSPTAQAAPGQAGSLGGVTGSAGSDSNSFTVGLRHRF